MGKVIASITTSVDGYVTGPDDGPECGLGKGGERLHYWVMGGPWTYDGGHEFAMHGPDKEFFDELVRRSRPASSAAACTTPPVPGAAPTRSPGHCSCSPTAPRTSRPRRRGSRSSPASTTRWPRRAAAAGTGDVSVGGGADVIRQALAAGEVDELVISTAPVILGAGKRLFDGFDRDVDLEVVKVYSSSYATHVRYTVAR